MDRNEKEKQVEELKQLIHGKNSVFLTDYRGMTVEQMFALRRAFDKVGASYRVVKNTLAKIAVGGTKYELLAEGLTGTTGVVVSDDAVALVKVLLEHAKKFDKLKLRYAYLEGARVDATQFEAVSRLPGKDELRAKLLSVFQAASSSFVSVLAAAPRDFVGVLSARKDSLDQGGTEPN